MYESRRVVRTKQGGDAADVNRLPAKPPVQAISDATRDGVGRRLKIALRAAEQAGATLMRGFGEATYAEKSPIDLVTKWDRASEEIILAEIRASFGADVVLAEETDGDDGAVALASTVAEHPWVWAVDPLDGTTNFAHSHLQFAVSIGVLRFGEPVLGVVLAPARKEVFVGGAGLRPTCNGRQIAVSTQCSLDKSLLATGFPYDRRERLDEVLAPLRQALLKSHGVRRAGCAAMDLCELAAGRLDGFWEVGLHPWDVVAGVAIVQAAGGVVTAVDGGQHDAFAANTAASNGQIHAALLEMLQ